MTKMNTKIIYKQLLCLIVAFSFIQCNDTKDDYFKRPEWLASSIYEVLKSEGHFKLYLQCVDKTKYSNVLKGAGLYTVFAPNDDAFTLWLQDKSFASVNEIPDETVENIVAYSIVYSKWPFSRLAYRLESGQYGTYPEALKRQTVHYSLPYQDDEYNGNWVFDETVRGSISYSSSDYQLNLLQQNYKYLPIYTNDYFSLKHLSSEDYNTFYPDAEFTGSNVQDGTILYADILAENGIIHEVSRVNEPLKNIEQLLKTNPLCNSYYSLLNHKTALGGYAFKEYVNSFDISNKLLETFQKTLPLENISDLYIKTFPRNMGFSPVVENIWGESGSKDTEISGNTLFVPENSALNQYINDKILKYYTSIDDVPATVIYTLINTHMANALIWPSYYAESFNSTGEYINGVGRTGNDFKNAGVTGNLMASNGFIYQINHVIKSRYFETVYSEIYLNPTRTLVNTAYSTILREELMRSPLNGYISERWSLLNISDELLADDGFGYDNLNVAFTHSESGNISNGLNTRLQRLIRSHIFPGIQNDEIDCVVDDFSTFSPFSGTTVYDGWGFLVNYYGDMIRFKDSQLQAAGNIEDGTFVTVKKQTDEFNNGYVFGLDKLLQYSPRVTKSGTKEAFEDYPLWTYLDRARTENPNVSDFVNYVEKCMKKLDSNELDGVKPELFYTVLMPSNSAMTNARNTGHIPSIDYLSGDHPAELAQATMFVNAHFLQGLVFADDGLEYIYPINTMTSSPSQSSASTLLKITSEKHDLVNQNTTVRVYKYKSGSNSVLRFEPLDIKRGNELLINGAVGTGAIDYINGVNRGRVSSTAQNNYRSNRIAGKAVLHEISNFIRFTVEE